jgi:hypothetical protein
MSGSNSLHRLVYISRQTPEVASDLDFEIGRIVSKSIANNRIDNLTGMLLAVQGCFLQALEGQEEAVRRAYIRITADPRHVELKLISAGSAESRLFGEWNMCARSLSSCDRAIVDVIDAKGAFESARLTPVSATRLLTSVAAIQRRTALASLTA